MTRARIVSLVEGLWHGGSFGLGRLNEQARDWFKMLWGAAQQALKPSSVITAAAIAYFSIFSLFPLTLLSVAVASFRLGPLMDQQAVIQKLEFIAPAMGQLLGKNIDEIIIARGPVTSIALLGLIWSASTVFNTLTHALNGIWNVTHRRAIWKGRGLSMLFVLALVGPILFVASFFGSVIVGLRNWFPHQAIPIVGLFGFILAITFNVALFFALYIVLPHGGSSWREILPGAFAAGLLWESAKRAFLFFISSYISVSNLVYGSVAAIIATLTWAYLSGLIFLFGAYLSVAYFEFRQSRQEVAARTSISADVRTLP